jgi:hypothetical protein
MQVSLMRGRVCINEHAPKFVTTEAPALMTNALLPEQNRPGGTAANQQGCQQRQRDQEWQYQRDQQNIQRPLPVQDPNCLG